MASIKLGDLLLKAKVLSETQLMAALAEQKKWGGRLGEILVRMDILTEEMLVKALSKQLNIPAVNLDAIQGVPAHVLAKVPMEMAREMSALPLQLRDDGRTLVVVFAEPQNLGMIDTLRSITRCRIMPQIAGRSTIERAFERFFEGGGAATDVEDSFKFVDAQGNTVRKASSDDGMELLPAGGAAIPAPMTSPPRVSMSDVPAVAVSSFSPAEQLQQIEESQRKEVAALKGMVELLIEKGVFSRDEYLAKVRK